MSEKKYDLVVIGAGPGGYVASIVAAQKGMKVANIEKRETLGGTCLNVGCIPSKALLHASEQYENNVKNNANLSWGIKTSDVSIDVQQLMKKKSSIVDELTKGINFLFSKNKIDKYIGEATLIHKNEIQIKRKGKTEKIFAEKIIIASGSEPSNLKNIKIELLLNKNVIDENITEAKYKGKTVKLNKPMRGDVKKFKVYVNTGKKNAVFEGFNKANNESPCAIAFSNLTRMGVEYYTNQEGIVLYTGNMMKDKYEGKYNECYSDCLIDPAGDARIYCGNGSECDAFCFNQS